MLRLTFQFVKTESAAIALCDSIQSSQNSYRRKHHKPSYTPWTSSDGSEHAYVVWYKY